jgi:hypothetical protein
VDAEATRVRFDGAGHDRLTFRGDVGETAQEPLETGLDALETGHDV